jgi:hypothetical protein
MISELISDLSSAPFDPQKNFDVAVEYERLGQTASAVSFYLRTAEYGGQDSLLVYSSLLKLAKCFENQTGRDYTVTNCILQAIAYMPFRPEGLFLLSRWHERRSNWQECYTFAELGLHHSGLKPLPIDVEYPGVYGLMFEKAVSAYWVGRAAESISLFNHLLTLNIAPEYRSSIEDNLRRLNVSV